MPCTTITSSFEWQSETRRNIMDAVHRCLVEAFKIPENDKLIRFVSQDANDMLLPPDANPRYLLIEVAMFPGRSIEAKRVFYRNIVGAMKVFDVPPRDIRIVLHEQPRENWGIRGGLAASDIDLGFKVEV